MYRDVMLQVDNLTTAFTSSTGLFGGNQIEVAVNNVSLAIEKGEVVGLVGPSGSGKSTLARTLLRLIEPRDGSIVFDGKDVLAMRGNDLKNYRCKAQIIFQNPDTALRTDWSVRQILSEPIVYHKITDEPDKLIKTLLEQMELSLGIIDRYAFELSGGQLQRVAVARALSLNPSFLIADEILSALDLSVQGAILILMKRLIKENGLTLLFISHDHRSLKSIADRIITMKEGVIIN